MELTTSVMSVATTVTKTEFCRKREEVELLQRLGVVLGGEAHLAHRHRARRSARLTISPGFCGIDHLRHRADAPDLREHALAAVLAASPR